MRTKKRSKKRFSGHGNIFTTGGGELRLWTGIPVGAVLTYAAGKVMPDFTSSIPNQYLYGLPYSAPAALLGVGLLLSPKFRQAGWGVLIGTAGYYLQSTFFNVGVETQYQKQLDLDKEAGIQSQVI